MSLRGGYGDSSPSDMWGFKLKAMPCTYEELASGVLDDIGVRHIEFALQDPQHVMLQSEHPYRRQAGTWPICLKGAKRIEISFHGRSSLMSDDRLEICSMEDDCLSRCSDEEGFPGTKGRAPFILEGEACMIRFTPSDQEVDNINMESHLPWGWQLAVRPLAAPPTDFEKLLKRPQAVLLSWGESPQPTATQAESSSGGLKLRAYSPAPLFSDPTTSDGQPRRYLRVGAVVVVLEGRESAGQTWHRIRLKDGDVVVTKEEAAETLKRQPSSSHSRLKQTGGFQLGSSLIKRGSVHPDNGALEFWSRETDDDGRVSHGVREETCGSGTVQDTSCACPLTSCNTMYLFVWSRYCSGGWSPR